MSEIEVAADEIADLADAAPEAETIKRKLGWTFWLCIAWLVAIVLAAILAPWFAPPTR